MVFRDITKERELEDKLSRAERLASLGIMAGGIAHEIRNPLSPIVGCAELLYDIENDEKKREYLGMINSAAQKIERIVKGMLFLAREGSINTSDVNIGEVIDDVLKNINETVGHGSLNIVKDLQYTGSVKIDKELFGIALLNLLKNALQAIEESKKGDTITVRTFKDNALIRIEVSDNGPGIPKDHLHLIFDPFFTTKRAKKGTGLGLSIAHRIVTAHKGEITVQSREGEGTTFTITIPE